MLVGELEYTIESLEYLAVIVLKGLNVSSHYGRRQAGIHHVEQRLVVFVDKYHDTSACLLVGFPENVCQTVAIGVGKLILTIFFLTFCNEGLNGFLELHRRGEVLSVEVNMEHRIFLPLLL